MTSNTQFGFLASLPTPRPIGASVSFVVPSGIDTISGKAGAGGWCTAGNLWLSDDAGHWIECSITYANGCTNCPPTNGWYFWFGSSSNVNGNWSSLGTNPVGDSVTLKITWNGSQYQASLTDSTHSGNDKLVGYGSGAPAQFTVQDARVFFENSNDTTCADYTNNYGGEDFKNMTYYDSSGNTISYVPSGTSYSQNNPNNCSPPNLTFG